MHFFKLLQWQSVLSSLSYPHLWRCLTKLKNKSYVSLGCKQLWLSMFQSIHLLRLGNIPEVFKLGTTNIPWFNCSFSVFKLLSTFIIRYLVWLARHKSCIIVWYKFSLNLKTEQRQCWKLEFKCFVFVFCCCFQFFLLDVSGYTQFSFNTDSLYSQNWGMLG